MVRTGSQSLRLAVGLALLGSLALASGCGGSKTEAPAAPGTPAARQTGSSLPPSTGAPTVPPVASPSHPQRDPSIVVATVDGRPITVRQVYGLASAYRMRLEQRGTTIPPEQETDLLRMSLQSLINSDLMAHAAKAVGQKVDPKALEDRIREQRSRFPSEEDYRKSLAASKVTEEQIRADLETQLLAEGWARSKTQDVKVDPAAVRKVYDSNKDKFKGSEEAHVLEILATFEPSDPPAKKEEARKRAEEAYAKAKAGEDFGKVAGRYSQDPSAANGGDLGFVPRGMTFPQFEEPAFSLPIGQISPVFETPRGFNVIKVLERRPERQLPWDEVKEKLTENITSRLKGQTLQGQISLLRSKAKVSITDKELEPPP